MKARAKLLSTSKSFFAYTLQAYDLFIFGEIEDFLEESTPYILTQIHLNIAIKQAKFTTNITIKIHKQF